MTLTLIANMNELISKLFKQSGGIIEIENGNFWTYTTENYDPELFAKLIVKECASIADTAEPFLASDLIKQHFGVDE